MLPNDISVFTETKRLFKVDPNTKTKKSRKQAKKKINGKASLISLKSLDALDKFRDDMSEMKGYRSYDSGSDPDNESSVSGSSINNRSVILSSKYKPKELDPKIGIEYKEFVDSIFREQLYTDLPDGYTSIGKMASTNYQKTIDLVTEHGTDVYSEPIVVISKVAKRYLFIPDPDSSSKIFNENRYLVSSTTKRRASNYLQDSDETYRSFAGILPNEKKHMATITGCSEPVPLTRVLEYSQRFIKDTRKIEEIFADRYINKILSNSFRVNGSSVVIKDLLIPVIGKENVPKLLAYYKLVLSGGHKILYVSTNNVRSVCKFLSKLNRGIFGPDSYDILTVKSGYIRPSIESLVDIQAEYGDTIFGPLGIVLMPSSASSIYHNTIFGLMSGIIVYPNKQVREITGAQVPGMILKNISGSYVENKHVPWLKMSGPFIPAKTNLFPSDRKMFYVSEIYDFLSETDDITTDAER